MSLLPWVSNSALRSPVLTTYGAASMLDDVVLTGLNVYVMTFDHGKKTVR